jgi:hypothetical protein
LEGVNIDENLGSEFFADARLKILASVEEVLYVLFFIWLICSGPGKFSVDYWLASTLWA